MTRQGANIHTSYGSVVVTRTAAHSHLVGVLAIMAGSILFVGAFLLKPNDVERRLIPSMRTQAQTIPPEYTAKKVAHGGRLGSALARERRLRRS